MAEEEGLKVDHDGFEVEMTAQRERARAARSTENSMNVQSAVLSELKMASEFIGYDKTVASCTLLAIVQNDNEVTSTSTGEAQLIFNSTPFYAEMGGQVADTGVIKNEAGDIVAKVVSVKKTKWSTLTHG